MINTICVVILTLVLVVALMPSVVANIKEVLTVIKNKEECGSRIMQQLPAILGVGGTHITRTELSYETKVMKHSVYEGDNEIFYAEWVYPRGKPPIIKTVSEPNVSVKDIEVFIKAVEEKLNG